MLSDAVPTTMLAVADLERARRFYEGTLGFVGDTGDPEGVAYTAGTGQFVVYVSAYAGTNQATAMTFQVSSDDFGAEIADLRERGITFETYDLDGVEWDDDIAVLGAARAAWFRDPDGNILAVEARVEPTSTSP